jgi:hypothetical protein
MYIGRHSPLAILVWINAKIESTSARKNSGYNSINSLNVDCVREGASSRAQIKYKSEKDPNVSSKSKAIALGADMFLLLSTKMVLALPALNVLIRGLRRDTEYM